MYTAIANERSGVSQVLELYGRVLFQEKTGLAASGEEVSGKTGKEKVSGETGKEEEEDDWGEWEEQKKPLKSPARCILALGSPLNNNYLVFCAHGTINVVLSQVHSMAFHLCIHC